MTFAIIAIARLRVAFKESLAGTRSSAAGWSVAAMMMVRARHRIVVP